MKRYVFDYSRSTIADDLKRLGVPLVIKAVDGQHELDFDIDHSSYTEAENRKMRNRADVIIRKEGRKMAEGYEDLPIGFNFKSLPVGTVVTVQEDGNA